MRLNTSRIRLYPITRKSTSGSSQKNKKMLSKYFVLSLRHLCLSFCSVSASQSVSARIEPREGPWNRLLLRQTHARKRDGRIRG